MASNLMKNHPMIKGGCYPPLNQEYEYHAYF
jgi:hypothetical protein